MSRYEQMRIALTVILSFIGFCASGLVLILVALMRLDPSFALVIFIGFTGAYIGSALASPDNFPVAETPTSR